MKIFTRVLLGFLAFCLVFGSQAAAFGVVPVGTRSTDASKSDSVQMVWRSGTSLTVMDFGISTALNLPSYNPNAKKYSPFLHVTNNKKNKSLALKPSVRNASSYKSGISRSVSAAMKEHKVIPSLSAYPNPSTGIINFSLNPVGDDNYKVRISNTIGKVIRTYEVGQTALPPVDLSELPAGIYFYSLLVNDKMVETKRLILQ
ncbi:T9SS type A sorting domain-containing protein [Nibribacter koreensis]|uniref:Secretion system C-terminal sorting domain-containing protein n=1 Tax=Nibribacter koreensis TaxID=1084519 RepID=A0ABP8FHQ3_9BACT